ncbi:hypothetical protein SAMN04487846_2067 [Microbacterium sp. cf046]|nr:hypothetical protein SAMN04487846_2067 [Microbacterium sp. cf046]
MWASLAAALALTGCTGEPSTPSPSQTSAPASGSPAPIVTPSAAPVIVPGGTAEENLPVFSMVTAAVWASPQQVSGRAYVDALVTAGFDKSAMQVTYDESTVGDPAESIQFAVRWGDECLVGQVGPSTGSPVTVVVPALSEGTCLVGSTRPIDW